MIEYDIQNVKITNKILSVNVCDRWSATRWQS